MGENITSLMKTIRILLFGLLLFATGPFAVGQEESAPLFPLLEPRFTGPPFSQPVDPDLYLIRPGDVLQMVFVRSELAPETLMVDPEGRVINNTLGIFDLTDKNLSETREILMEAVRRLYSIPDVAIGITEPRQVSISVYGTVAQPGTYSVYTSQRVSEVLAAAGGVPPEGSTRWITLSGGPRTLTVDLDRAVYTSDLKADPCVYAGQVVRVPNKSRNTVNITGEVHNPREIELAEGDDLQLLLELAGGLRSRADSTRIRVIRKSGEAFNGKLRGGDVILVPRRELSVEEMPLAIFGAVKNPGLYDYGEGMTVGALIDLAGGLLPDANLGNTTVFRRPLMDELGRATHFRSAISDLAGNDEIFRSIKLQPDDSVFVPLKIGFVAVRGAVARPGHVPYIEGKDAMFYINSAGGFLPVAKRDMVNVYNPVSKLTAISPPGVLVSDGSVVTIEVKEEVR